MLYFDHNATSPLCAVAREAWLNAVERFPANPSSPHRLGARAARALDEARERLAALFGFGAHEIVWTSGATESANTVFAQFAGSSRGAWISAIEHPCVIASSERAFGAEKVTRIPISGAQVDIGWIERRLQQGERPALVAVMAANNETGALQPWREVRELCRVAGVPFFCDAVQALGRVAVDGLGQCDYISGCGHKVGAPRGVGFLKAPGALRPLIVGGPQEEDRRAGTENVAGVLAMVATLEHRQSALARGENAVREEWRQEFLRSLPDGSEEVVAIGQPVLWNTVSVALPELPGCQRWVVKLDKHGVAASTGSACSSGQEKISHVLEAMGLPPDKASRVIRFSSGWETTREEWQKAARAVAAVSGSSL